MHKVRRRLALERFSRSSWTALSLDIHGYRHSVFLISTISGAWNILETLEAVWTSPGNTQAVVLGYDGFLRVVLVFFEVLLFTLDKQWDASYENSGWSFEKERQL